MVPIACVFVCMLACVLSISSSEDDSSFSFGETGGRGKSLCVKLETRGEMGGGSISSSNSLKGNGFL